MITWDVAAVAGLTLATAAALGWRLCRLCEVRRLHERAEAAFERGRLEGEKQGYEAGAKVGFERGVHAGAHAAVNLVSRQHTHNRVLLATLAARRMIVGGMRESE